MSDLDSETEDDYGAEVYIQKSRWPVAMERISPPTLHLATSTYTQLEPLFVTLSKTVLRHCEWLARDEGTRSKTRWEWSTWEMVWLNNLSLLLAQQWCPAAWRQASVYHRHVFGPSQRDISGDT